MPGKITLKTVSEELREASKTLRPKRITCEADQDLGWLEAEILLAHTIGKDRTWIVAHGNDLLSPILERRFQKFVDRRKKHEPIAYITGVKDFYGQPFIVNRKTLIPRPETELMIDTLKRHYKKNDAMTVWDVGTGSGAIAITVALEFPHAQIIASDTCNRALNVARKNAKLHNVEKRITFIQGNLLTHEILNVISESSTSTPLIILANLPYLPMSDQKKLAKDVTNFEPAKALYSGKDGLDLIRKLFEQISKKLNTNPNLVLAEFDPPQTKAIKELAKNAFPIANVSIHQDIAKRDRLIEIKEK